MSLHAWFLEIPLRCRQHKSIKWKISRLNWELPNQKLEHSCIIHPELFALHRSQQQHIWRRYHFQIHWKINRELCSRREETLSSLLHFTRSVLQIFWLEFRRGPWQLDDDLMNSLKLILLCALAFHVCSYFQEFSLKWLSPRSFLV